MLVVVGCSPAEPSQTQDVAGSGGAGVGAAGAPPASGGAGGSAAGTPGAVGQASGAPSGGGGGDTAGGGAGGSVGQPAPRSFLYVSGYAPPITTFGFDPESGALEETSSVSTGEGGEPTLIAFSPDKTRAYAIDEQLDGPLARVIAYSVDQESGALAEINRQDVGTSVNAHVEVHPSGSWVLSANYGGGSVTVFAVREDGGLQPGMPPVPAGVRAHQIVFDGSGTKLFVPCLEGHIALYDFDQGNLTPRQPATVDIDGGARHMAFGPDERFAYVLTQNESTITQFAYDRATAAFTPIETLNAAPGRALSAHIALHRSGKFLYASNRNDDSIAMFAVDPDTGRLTSLGYQRQSLDFPRFFALDSSGEWLVVSSQNSAEILLHRIDPQLGTLTVTGTPIAVPPRPTFVGFLTVP